MNQVDLVAATVGEFREAYRLAALEHAAASARGRHRVMNRNYDLLISVVRELRGRGRAGEHVIEELMQDDDGAVRLWAATHALPFSPAAAEAVLSELATRPPSPQRLDAEMTLREWRAGRPELE